MTEWHWIDPAVVFAVHDYQLGEHGGSESVRDHGLIESAQARPRNLRHTVSLMKLTWPRPMPMDLRKITA
jgi:hypothetical protein